MGVITNVCVSFEQGSLYVAQEHMQWATYISHLSMGVQHVGHGASARWTSEMCAKYAIAGATEGVRRTPAQDRHAHALSEENLIISVSHDRDLEAATGGEGGDLD
eukprot:6180377-Pleurochrysis_carterae.AAC.3